MRLRQALGFLSVMSEVDERVVELLRRQVMRLFRRGDLDDHDKKLVEKWILRFAKMEAEDASG